MAKCKNKKTFCKKYSRYIGVAAITVLVSLFTYFVGTSSFLYRTSVVSWPEHAAFNGTVYPVKKVPNWVKLSTEKWKASYNMLSNSDLINTPYYNPSNLSKSTDNLVWGNADDDQVRNEKITYSVPYMGNYLLDGQENAGSHLAVDIKIPENTPVYAIANGTVIKVSNQSSGFGHHVVIMHNNFPTLEKKSAKETIYSTYNHLNDILVSEGDVVKKGEQIALSGRTGTATTPHLHFQIDNSDAPWHPFWPFTTAEASAAGYDFFGAVNAGLGKESALDTTINPMKYVQKYLDGSASYTENESEEEEEVASEDDNSNPDVESYVENNNDNQEVAVTETNTNASSSFVIETSQTYASKGEKNFKVKLNGNLDAAATLTTENDLVNVSKDTLKPFDFGSNGEFMGTLKGNQLGKDRLKLEYNGATYYSDWFEITETPTSANFSDVSESHPNYVAISYLVSKGVVSGYPDGTFKPDNPVSRVEVLKFILAGIKESLKSGKLPFSDVSNSEWYSKYLYTAYKKEIVNGNPDGSYRPTYPVNRAEFYKILLNGMETKVPESVDSTPFTDVAAQDWFAPFVVTAWNREIIDHSSRTLRPQDNMTRAEVAEAMYRVMEK